MLQLHNISKQYKTGDLVQTALNEVSLNLRDNEFVAILGPSGSGKSTMLNIIGGLDRYDSGDLIINGISTKKYTDRDWDSYRNHTIGFVFQSYNLIPHQTVLANVELALTISGISRAERRHRAQEALRQVGLGDQMHKKPNQMSGGQMQRVAIARALVNNPDILLADEPTGALDTETSIQVMELLKEVAKDRLVVMVTHNPELAEQYATRIVRIQDGVLKSDSDPYVVDESLLAEPEHKNMGHSSMSFLTSLSLSLNNLATKKTRTFMTAFAGSIGIIGIALILSISTGVNDYIQNIEEETMSEYPIQITSSGFDLTSIMSTQDTLSSSANEAEEDTITVTEILSSMFSSLSSNDIAALKTYLDSGESGIEDYVKGIEYIYDIEPQIYIADGDDYRQVNPNSLSSSSSSISASSSVSSYMSLMTSYISGMNVFYEMPENEELYINQYEVKAGRWPENYNECVLVLTSSGSVSDLMLYMLGLEDYSVLDDMINRYQDGEDVTVDAAEGTYSYDDVLGITFQLITSADYYAYDSEYEIWVDKSGDASYMSEVIANGEEMTIVGIVQPVENASSEALTSGINYPASLIEHIVEKASESEIVKEQMANPDINVLSGEEFGEETSDFDLSSILTIDEDALADMFDFGSMEDMIDTSSLTDALDLDSLDMDLDLDFSDMDLGEMELDLSGLDFSGLDFSGMELDLSGLDLSGLELDLSGLDLSGLATDFGSLDLSGIDLSGIDLEGIDLEGILMDSISISLPEEDLSGMMDALAYELIDGYWSENVVEIYQKESLEESLEAVLSDYLNTDEAKASLAEFYLETGMGEMTTEDMISILMGNKSISDFTQSEEVADRFTELSVELMSGFYTYFSSNALIAGSESFTEYLTGDKAAGILEAFTANMSDEFQLEVDSVTLEEALTTAVEDQIVSVLEDQLAQVMEQYMTSMMNTLQGAITAAIEEQMTSIMAQVSQAIEAQMASIMEEAMAQISEQITAAIEEQMTEIMEQMADSIEEQITDAMSDVMEQMADSIEAAMEDMMKEMEESMEEMFQIDEEALAEVFEFNLDSEGLAEIMSSLTSSGSTTYSSNLESFGYIDFGNPSEIDIYPSDFKNKEKVINILDDYNQRMEDEGKSEQVITYTDTVGLLMSSVTTIIDVISYVLIAFVSVSLIVSSIMIGIITYISVLERTREIGILRAIGASKNNISQIFNAETLIVGFCAGAIGIGISYALLVPINYLIHRFAETTDVSAVLMPRYAVILVILSMVLTLIGGLIPSTSAAKKDPVTALRTE
ncbi:MAG: ATP-binding cassette domain-containing protein [Lachnospiraceae bacterium]|nr:ATP-binding cassette domain-containing protein [Lachnospiraceae bacterium]